MPEERKDQSPFPRIFLNGDQEIIYGKEPVEPKDAEKLLSKLRGICSHCDYILDDLQERMKDYLEDPYDHPRSKFKKNIMANRSVLFHELGFKEPEAGDDISENIPWPLSAVAKWLKKLRDMLDEYSRDSLQSEVELGEKKVDITKVALTLKALGNLLLSIDDEFFSGRAEGTISILTGNKGHILDTVRMCMMDIRTTGKYLEHHYGVSRGEISNIGKETRERL